jgi:exodeoxyribonuclease VII small subunit
MSCSEEQGVQCRLRLVIAGREAGHMAEKKFETALARLEEIVSQLEQGDLPLEQSLKLFEEGVKLARLCAVRLEEAERKVEQLLKDKAGKLVKTPFDEEGE